MRENGMVLCSHNQTTLKERKKECRAVGECRERHRRSLEHCQKIPPGVQCGRKLGTMYCEEEAEGVGRSVTLAVVLCDANLLRVPLLQLRNNDRLLAELREANQSLTDRLESLSRSLRGGGGGQQSLSSSQGHHPQTSSSSQGNNNSQNAISLLGELEQLSSADSDYSTMATTASRASSFLGGRNSSCRRCG